MATLREGGLGVCLFVFLDNTLASAPNYFQKSLHYKSNLVIFMMQLIMCKYMNLSISVEEFVHTNI